MILKYTVLLLVLTKVVLSYKQYKFSELCTGNKFKTIFDKITNNKPEVKLNEGDLSAALLVHHWNSTSYAKYRSCDFNVKLDGSYGHGSGLFASIKKLNLRANDYDHSCVDYIRFNYKNGTRTRPICGNIDTTVTNNLIRNFFDDTSGEMNVEISIDTSLYRENLEVYLVFTAYSRCYASSNVLQCSPEKCIAEVLRDDNVLNCPPPKCSDESQCINYEKPYIVSTPTNDNGSSYIIVPIVVLVLGALLSIICFCKKKKPATNRPENHEHIQELQPTARSDLDSYLEFQDVQLMPRASQQNERILPYASQPMPSAPRLMPSAPPQLGYKDDPPPYDALFDAIPSKRANV